jgi:hypothetical protein
LRGRTDRVERGKRMGKEKEGKYFTRPLYNKGGFFLEELTVNLFLCRPAEQWNKMLPNGLEGKINALDYDGKNMPLFDGWEDEDFEKVCACASC